MPEGIRHLAQNTVAKFASEHIIHQFKIVDIKVSDTIRTRGMVLNPFFYPGEQVPRFPATGGIRDASIAKTDRAMRFFDRNERIMQDVIIAISKMSADETCVLIKSSLYGM